MIKKNRTIEWEHSIIMIVIGIVILLPFHQALSTPAAAGMVAVMSENAWGMTFLSVGIIRVIALIINGKLPLGSPLARVIGASFNSILLSVIVVSFYDAYPSGLWAGSIYLIFVFFEMRIIYLATKDLLENVNNS